MDFSSLVLAPCQDIFGKQIVVTPLVSIPGYIDPITRLSTYTARGIWTVRHVDIALLDGGVLSSETISVDIRISEFPAEPTQGDKITIISDDQYTIFGISPGTPVDLLVDDVQDDSGGGTKLILKRIM